MADLLLSMNHCIINLLTSEERRRMRYYLMGDMSIISPSHPCPFCIRLLAINTSNQQSICDILKLSLSTFLITGQTHDWCTVHLSSSPWARITLDLNNSSHLFVIPPPNFKAQAAVKLEDLKSQVSFLPLPPSYIHTSVITTKGNCVFLKRFWEAVYWPAGISSGNITVGEVIRVLATPRIQTAPLWKLF